MPHTIHMPRSAVQTLGEDLSAAIYAAVQRMATYRTYRRTIRELQELSARDLSDLGLHRSEIKRVARDAVYGHRS
ncbi:hypothetical protein RA2_03115 [Roseovarius sp. A-2]|uniref:DUF1127 domain-containing protein n=1 Tax=Roseovarius sp. A-2 TaxID=1570360 RepID=UPI0009B5567A|nr:DUF1127 domain-containing protein [Roseovarius sp. A-2]GAW36047.1 hypothetical protein RA2_03115 [Roseovarius sp. A-2]